MISAVDRSDDRNEITRDSVADHFSFDKQIQKLKTLFDNRPPLDELVGDYIITPLLARTPSFTKVVGELVAYNLIYPKIPEDVLEEETRFAEIDRNPSIPSSEPIKDQVKRDFKIFQEEVSLEDHGLWASCLVYESKRGNKQLPHRNIILFCGNLNSNEITRDPYPFARAWLELEEEDHNLAPLRITVVSGRNIYQDEQPFIPPLAITGEVHKAILDQLIDAHGPIDQIVAFSLGCGVAAKVMDSIDDESIDHYPKKWWLHNGPSSLELVSKIYPAGRSFLWPAAKLVGWDVNPALSLKDFCGRIKRLEKTDEFSIGVSGLYGDRDHHFPLEVGLCNSPEVALLKAAGEIQHLLKITLSQVDFHEKDHHGRSLDNIELKHLVDPIKGDFYLRPLHPENNDEQGEVPFILPGEHLARSILRQLLSPDRKEARSPTARG